MDNSKQNINKFILVGLGNLKRDNVKNAVSANLFFIKFKYEGSFSVEYEIISLTFIILYKMLFQNILLDI